MYNGAARSVLRRLETEYDESALNVQAWGALGPDCLNSSRRRHRTLLQRFCSSHTSVKTDLNDFLPGLCSIRDELSAMGRIVLNEQITAIILDALPSIYEP